ncbi:FIST N-terminal domain-containing protein [Neptuniibacter sp.]|uniref:FIST N-terminal domain-containing protein n=1 Tax=Neptuniibacter sp. TaxID=1962643 RepID=UPI00261F6768|nr:FIST N-terminal domain-containing protein [Neptuniibacter sp.]MCP4598334.1 FIST domain containing protein [Neptuniibacter sp.]
MVQMRSGSSSLSDPSNAVEQIYDAVIQEQTSLVIIFCSGNYALSTLAESIQSKFADIPVVGCTTSGCIGRQGYQQQALVACSFSNEAFEFSTALIPEVTTFSYHKADAVVAQLRTELEVKQNSAINSEQMFAFQLIDGLCQREENFTQMLASALNGVALLGGSAGDNLKLESTHVYYQGKFHNNAAVVVLGYTALPFSPFMIQHFKATEARLVVTDSVPEKRMVKELNGLPAAEEYARHVGVDVTELTPEIFAAHPVLVKIGDSSFIRSIQQIGSDNSLVFFCAIDDGIVLNIAVAENIIENLQQEFQRLEECLGRVELTLGFDCIFRYLELKNTGKLQDASEVLCQHHFTGFNSYGEQYNATHVNQTLTGIAFGSGHGGEHG